MSLVIIFGTPLRLHLIDTVGRTGRTRWEGWLGATGRARRRKHVSLCLRHQGRRQSPIRSIHAIRILWLRRTWNSSMRSRHSRHIAAVGTMHHAQSTLHTSINQSISLLKAKGPDRHLHRSTRSSAIAEGPRDAPRQLKSCQLPRNSAQTTRRRSYEVGGLQWADV